MSKENSTLIAVVLDRSGSMSSLRESTVAGLNQFLRGQREVVGEVKFHLVQFDDQYEIHRDMADLRAIPDLTQEDFQPRGSTALFDAIGRTIQDVGARLAATPENLRPSKVVFVVQTDGFENASREYSQGRIQDMIKHQREKYSWDFVFLGANQDAILSGGALGFLPGQSLSYNANVGSTMKSFQMVNAAVSSSRMRGAGGQSVFSNVARSYASDDSINYSAALDSLKDTEDETLTQTVSGTGGQPTTTPGSET